MKRRRGVGGRAVRRLAIAVHLAAAFLLAGCADRGEKAGATPSQAVGPFRISVENKPARPVVGNNTLCITVMDPSGSPVRGAEVEALVVMQAMGTMPRMESRGQLKEAKPGLYEAAYGLSMAGEWDVDISVRTPEGAQAVASYRLSTSTKDLLFVSGTAPPGAKAGGDSSGVTGGGPPGEGGVVMIDPARRQAIGVRTAPVSKKALTTTIRAAGKVAYDETRRAEVSLKFSGWVRSIAVDYVGRVVRRGEPLFSAYSPELLATQQEYLEALKPVAGSAGGEADLAQAARQRLLLWDITPDQIDAIARAGKPLDSVPIEAPVGGVVVEKNVVQGSAFTAGQALYKIAPIHPVWVLANVFQYELPLIRRGMGASIQTPFLESQSRRGTVSFVSPSLDPATRTGEVRIETPNLGGDLKPGMFVDVVLQRDLGKRLAVPESAVLFSGDRRVVFVDLGDGRLVPRDVTLGVKAGDDYEVLAGVREGEIVVVSGNFLVAAESRIKSGAGRF